MSLDSKENIIFLPHCFLLVTPS